MFNLECISVDCELTKPSAFGLLTQVRHGKINKGVLETSGSKNRSSFVEH